MVNNHDHDHDQAQPVVYARNEDLTRLLDIIKTQNKLIDNQTKTINLVNESLQAQITNLQKQIVLLASAGLSLTDATEQGLELLHKEALKLPEGASKTGEGEDEDTY